MRPNGQALLESRGIFETKPHRKAFPDDRQVQGKTRVRSIGVRVRSRQEAKRHQPSEWSIGVRVKPPENWWSFYDYPSDAPTDPALACVDEWPAPKHQGQSLHVRCGWPANLRSGVRKHR